jgi:putative tryptophan/tyrosine transport system substrate-binding protein
MKRREFIGLIGAAAASPLAVRAQQARKLYRIGVLSPDRLPPELLEPFYQGLRELGYIDGQNISLEIRNADGDSHRLAAFASELVGLKVDAILAVNTQAAVAAKNATAIIPIIITRLADPVRTGLVPNLYKPSGNITGVSFMSDELSAKRIELLKEALPSVSRVGALWYDGNSGAALTVDGMRAPSRRLGLELILLPLQQPENLGATFEIARDAQVEALIIVDDVIITQHKFDILDFAAKHSLPVVSLYKPFAEAGALLAYGPNNAAMYYRAASYVGRILKGENPGDLPVEQPSKFDLVINLKTAKALGLTVPPTLLARADTVIE